MREPYTGGVDGLWRFDKQLFRDIHVGLHQFWLDPVFWVLSYSGLGQVQAVFILLLLFRRQSRSYVLPLLVSEIISGFAMGDVIKHFLPRDRPSNLLIAQPQEAWFSNSFPSGHTTSSFGIAFMLFLLVRKNQPWIGWVALGWATLVGVSRIYRGIHWPTDVLGGMFVGLAGATLTYLVLERFSLLPKP